MHKIAGVKHLVGAHDVSGGSIRAIPRHPRRKLKPLFSNLQIGWLDLVADTISSSRDGGNAGRASAGEGSRTVSPAKEKSLIKRSARDSGYGAG